MTPEEILKQEYPEEFDRESGIEHLKHIACNVAFLLELMREENHDKN